MSKYVSKDELDKMIQWISICPELPEQLRIAAVEYYCAAVEYDHAYAEYDRARVEYERAAAEYERARAEYAHACIVLSLILPSCIYTSNTVISKRKSLAAEYDRAWAEYDRAYRVWPETDREVWHAKWCGCKEWNGKEIVFKEHV